MIAHEAVYSVTIAGQNITAKLNGIVIDITVRDAAGQSSDTATIVLDDAGGRIRLPQKNDPILIGLGWADSGAIMVFEGQVDGVRSSGARGGGRILTIDAKSADLRSKVKEHREKHWDDKTLGEVMKEAGQLAGITVSVHPSLASIKRDYWSMANQSFVAFGERLAREVGATFKIRGNRAVMVPRNEGVGAGGTALPAIRAAWGDNLAVWDITPSTGRPQFKRYSVRWFDRREGKWKQEKVEAKPDVAPQSTDRYSEADPDTSEQRAESSKKGGERERGGGTVTIDGDPTAKAEAPVIVSGLRPGIDGVYRADVVEHRYTRGGGYLTTIDIKQPDDEAGKDKRGNGDKSSSKPAPGSYGEAGTPSIPGNVG
ncbi:MAG TPA: late control protein [Xanthobacteraceae bacterium]|nr:late control protein [Xanthobacteraceae bacterium]